MEDKAARKSLVALTEDTAEQDSAESSVIIGHRLLPEAAVRSDVLSGISDTEGLATLPGLLSPEDIQLWQTACVVECPLSTDELVIVAKVADVLGDSNGGAWIDMLADRVLATKWQDARLSNEMLCALLRLPPQLLKRILSAALTARSLDDLLAAFPLPLHPPLLGAAGSSGSLTLPKSSIDTFLLLLSTTPIPYPHLQSLRSTDPSTITANQTATAALLARALLAHTHVTTLKLDGLRVPPAWIRELTTSLTPSALPRLSELCVSTDVHPHGCAELGACLRNLPGLTALDVRLRYNKASAPNVPPTLVTYIKAASAPAQLPSLKRIMFVELHDDEDLGMQPNSSSCVHLLLPLLRAPALTYLRFASDAATVPYAALLRALRHFTSLQLLYVDAELRDAPGAAAPASDALPVARRSHSPPLTDALSALEKMDVKSGCAVCPLALAAATIAQAGGALTTLTIQHLHVGRGRYAAKYTPALLKAAWDALLPALGRAVSLRQLDLDNVCGVPDLVGPNSDSSALSWTEPLAAALSPLTRLTRLTLHGICEHCGPRPTAVLRVLSGARFGDALRELSGLQGLFVRSGTGHLEFDAPEAVLGVLPGLARLTALGLCCHGLKLAEVRDVVPKLRALSELELRTDMLRAGEEDLETFASRFPNIAVRRCGCEK